MSASLLPFNTFNLDHSCRRLIRATTKTELIDACKQAFYHDEPMLILGGGSNIILVADFVGTVIRIETKGITVTEDDSNFYLTVAAGESWHDLVVYTLKHQMPGLENLALIPGVVGAAPIQNIGAYGVEFCDCCAWVEYLDLANGKLKKLTAEQCQFSYRESVFKQNLKDIAVITEVGITLPKIWQPKLEYGPLKNLAKDNVSAKQVFDVICSVRAKKLPDPRVLGNAGSFFKNPIVSIKQYHRLKDQFKDLVAFPHGKHEMKLAAGWLIDNAGLKGYRQGTVGVHKQQALVLVNYGGAKGTDICQLANYIISKIDEFYDVTLEVEPRVITAVGEGAISNEG